jgi:hypothetical protein
MRPMLSAIVVALVLLTAAFLLAPLNAGRDSAPEAALSGIHSDAAPTYEVEATLGANPILPGYQDTLYYQVVNDTNHAPVGDLSYVTILGTYYNHAETLLNIPGTPATLSAAATGSWMFKLPVNASDAFGRSAVFTVWANSSALGENNSATVTLNVGHLALNVASVVDEVTGSPTVLIAGDPALVTAQAYVDSFGGNVPAANESLTLNWYSTGSSPVTSPVTLTTDYQGYARDTFTPVTTIFNVPGPDHTEFELVDSVNTSVSVFANVTWTLHNPSGTADFAFSLGSSQYYGGDKVTATWAWRGTNATVGTITVDTYYAYDTSTDAVIASGTVDSTAATGSFSFDLPPTFYGPFEVEAFAYNATESWTLGATATASAPTLSLNPSEIYYNPGDTITVSIATEGSIFSSATISAIVSTSGSGQTLFSGTVSGDSFSFTIPSTAPAPTYHIYVWASTTTAGTFAYASQNVDESAGFTFWAGVGTASSYSDGSYQPGQSVQITYKLTTLGTSALPTHVELLIDPIEGADSPALKVWNSVSTSGSVSFTIPSGTPNGVQTYIVESESSAGDYEALVSMNVNSAPSPLNYELGAGSGLTVGWLILLILIVIVVLAILVVGRRRRGGQMIMTPHTPEWKEPQAQASTPPSAGGPPSGGSTESPATPPESQ